MAVAGGGLVARYSERQARSSGLTDREHEAMQRVATGLLDKLLADELQVSVSLTEREHEAMQRVATGLLDKLLADELQVSVRTFEGHRARVDARLSVPVRRSGDAAGGMTVIPARRIPAAISGHQLPVGDQRRAVRLRRSAPPPVLSVAK